MLKFKNFDFNKQSKTAMRQGEKKKSRQNMFFNLP